MFKDKSKSVVITIEFIKNVNNVILELLM